MALCRDRNRGELCEYFFGDDFVNAGKTEQAMVERDSLLGEKWSSFGECLTVKEEDSGCLIAEWWRTSVWTIATRSQLPVEPIEVLLNAIEIDAEVVDHVA